MYTSASGQTDLRPSRATAWVGWIIFAATMMMISGSFSLIWGIVALVRDQVFVVGRNGNVTALDYTAWGWIQIILGVIVLVTGLFLLRGSLAAGVVAIMLASLSALANLLTIAAYPVWSVIVIAIDILVIYAITVHGDEMREN